LEQWKAEKPRKPLLLRGARQVGKTYIIKAFGQEQFPRVHYLNFEEDESLTRFFERDLRPARLLEEFRFYLGTGIDQKQDLLVFDEIQRCPRALTSLKYFCEEQPDLAICAAGSLLGLSLSSESFPVGKVTFLNLHPMNYFEFLEGLEETQLADCLRDISGEKPLPEAAHERLWDLWKSYLVVGGLPEVVNTYRNLRADRFTAIRAVRKLQRDLVNAYLADMAKHSGKVNAMHIERLWRSVPAQLARVQEGAAPKFRFRDAVTGIRGYERLAGPLDWLERADLVIRAYILDTVGVPLAGYAKENRFKLYFFDVGMLNAVSGLPPEVIMQYGFGSYQGYMAENFVAQELMAAGDEAIYSWQGRTSEVEFLIETGEGVVPWEVKSGRVVHTKSLNVYEERYRPERAYVLSSRSGESKGHRRHVPIYAAGVIRQLMVKSSNSLNI
jgi:predicted AAA+ superfamily ATPase